MNFRLALIVAGLLSLAPGLRGQSESVALPPVQGVSGGTLPSVSAARIAELERRIAALERMPFTPVAGLPPGATNSTAEAPPGPTPDPQIGTVLVSPPSPPPTVQASPEIDSSTWTSAHIVREGETLSSIARIHRTNSRELARMNGIRDANLIRSGQSLRVPSGSEPAPEAPARAQVQVRNTPPAPAATPKSPAPASPQPEETYYYYDIQEGDTILSVANTFFSTPEEVAKLNNIKATAILKVGQQLVVPTRRYFEEQKRTG